MTSLCAITAFVLDLRDVAPTATCSTRLHGLADEAVASTCEIEFARDGLGAMASRDRIHDPTVEGD